MFKRTAFALGGSAVVVSSVDANSEDNVKKSWSDLLPSFFSKKESSDNVAENDNKKSLTGRDRLYIMYTKDDSGHLSRELHAIIYGAYTSFFVGSLYGTISKTKEAHHEFLRNNQATQFQNIYDARRAMQDKVMMAGLKGFFYHGCRLAVFTGGLMTITISLMVFTNKISIFHYGLAGGSCGAIHRWRFGPKGMLAGGIVGGVLGLIAGSMTKGMFYMSGVNLSDVIHFQDDAMLERDKQWRDIHEAALSKNILQSEFLKEREKIINVDSTSPILEEKAENVKI